MKRFLSIVSLASLLAGSAAAQDRGFGVGFIVGEPTGAAAKLWQTRTTALDFAVAWSFARGSALHLHGDFLWHRFAVIHVDRGKLPIYYGLGARLKFEDEDEDTRLGVRFPVGLDYIFPSDPVDIFLEVVPILDLVSETDFSLNASFGVRYFF